MRKSLIMVVFLFIISVFGFEKNPYFSSEEEVEKFFWDSSDYDRDASFFSSLDPKKGILRIETRFFCSLPWSVFVDYDLINDSILCGKGLIAGINFEVEEGEDYCESINNIKVTKFQKDRAKIAIRYIVKKEILVYLEMDHSKEEREYERFKKGEISRYTPTSSATNFLKCNYIKYVPIDKSTVRLYNDMGFFLEQGGRYKEAIELLTEVIKAVPTRTVAYLNLGDAYWGIGDTIKARENYCKYIELMKAEKKEKRIPSHVKERCLQRDN